MTVYTSPEVLPEHLELPIFLAGGISNCPDWQAQLIAQLDAPTITLINPRREKYEDSEEVARAQIKWEYDAFKLVENDPFSAGANNWGSVLFWFPEETLCPITLLELGKMTQQRTPIFVGVHPNYARKLDVEVQLQLARPEVTVVYSLEDLARQIEDHYVL
jgi:hypothetical protein